VETHFVDTAGRRLQFLDAAERHGCR
jgi:hypothetical protein